MPTSLGKAPPRRLLCKRRPSKTTSHSETNQPQCASRSRDRGALFVIGCCGGAPKKLVRQHLGLRAALLPLFGGSPAAGHCLGVSKHRTATALAKPSGLMPGSSTDRQQGYRGSWAAAVQGACGSSSKWGWGSHLGVGFGGASWTISYGVLQWLQVTKRGGSANPVERCPPLLAVIGAVQREWRRGRESNSRIPVLQTSALPLCYLAKKSGRYTRLSLRGVNLSLCFFEEKCRVTFQGRAADRALPCCSWRRLRRGLGGLG